MRESLLTKICIFFCETSKVFALVAAFKAACSCDVPVHNGSRRAGDLAELYADPSRANAVLGWSASRSIADACADTWRFVSENPRGFTRCTVERFGKL